MVKLGDICKKASSAVAQKDLENNEGNYPIYGASGFIKNVDFYHQEQPYVAIVKDGAGVGRVMKLPASSSVIGTMQYIIPNEGVNVSYLAYALEHMNLSKYYLGAAIPHIYFKDYCNEMLPNHTTSEQEHIATELDKVSEMISLRKQQLTKLDELVKARFVELFGDPITNPMEWELHRFDSLCENLDYRRQPITASEREAGIYPYYGASGVVDYVADYLFDEDILLISEDGANLLMRSTPIAFSVSGKVWVNNHAHVVKFEKTSMQKYIEVFFSLIDVSDHITGSAQPKLNQAKLNAMMFPVPSDERLDAFLQFVEQTDKSKLTVQQSLDKLELLKKALMQKYFG